MSIAARVRLRVLRIPKGLPFALDRVISGDPRPAVSKALALMVCKGTLRRVVPGVFVRPEFSRLCGEVPVDVREVVYVMARARGEVLQIHGSEAVRHFRLSTQMQVVLTYYTSGRTRTFQLGLSKVRLIHARPAILQHAGSQVGAAVSALYYLGETTEAETALKTIMSRLSAAEQERLKSCRLPKWAAAML